MNNFTPHFMFIMDVIAYPCVFNTLRPRQNDRHFADDVFKCIFFNGNLWIAIKISLKFVPKGPINNVPALVQIMAWSRPGDKPLSEPMMISLLTHICVTRPQWVNPWIVKALVVTPNYVCMNLDNFVMYFSLSTTFVFRLHRIIFISV